MISMELTSYKTSAERYSLKHYIQRNSCICNSWPLFECPSVSPFQLLSQVVPNFQPSIMDLTMYYFPTGHSKICHEICITLWRTAKNHGYCYFYSVGSKVAYDIQNGNLGQGCIEMDSNESRMTTK